jgi:hypothetical protein
MSSIPPNIIGSIFQTQVSSAQNAKETDAQRNKRLRDARELARMADHQTHEVEDADQTEGLRVHREDEQQRDGGDARDTYDQHQKNESQKTPSSNPAPQKSHPDENSDQNKPDHIDLSA